MTEEKIIHLVEKKQGAYGSYENGVELEIIMSDLDKLSPYYRFIYKKLRNRYYRRIFKIPLGPPSDKYISAKYHEVNKELEINTAKIFELNERT